MADRVRINDFEVVPMLATMNLDKEGLVEVVRYAEAHRALCTSNDANGFARMVVYDKLARGMRERFCGEFWEKDDTNGQAGIRHRSQKIRIVPCNFDENAGNMLAQPANWSPKGEISRRGTRCNATGWLPGLPEVPAQQSADFKTWILGVHAADGEPLRAELSFPVEFNGRYYTRFPVRIILLAGGEDDPISKKERTGPTEVVDIPVTRR